MKSKCLILCLLFLLSTAFPCKKTYKIQREDTCDTISKTHDLDVDMLKRLNPALHCNRQLKLNKTICVVPVSFNSNAELTTSSSGLLDNVASSLFNVFNDKSESTGEFSDYGANADR
ncbi:hypothetical protein M3Y95_00203000 [Aphelenchoides besseyi]|nr:hypothetical protein M3Y95_00203000 [Aphelenchoides besseyi]